MTVCITVVGCASKKSDKKISFMQNLTAHYNIYYNASEILKESELNIRNAYRDDYSRQLEIFIVPDEAASEAETTNLTEVTDRANRIALEKYESNWVDDAFLLLAKAEYWKGNFFNAAEYFSYVSQNYPKEKKNTVEALVWQGRALFALNKNKEADSVLQLALRKNQKHYRAELNAALANSYLLQGKIEEAENHLKKSIIFSKNRYSKIRWSFILAQLQERNNKPEEAYKYYSKVVKSNAAFEMSFNANLAQVRLKETASGVQFDKIATLTKLLKEDKNRDFKDQIYYQIAKSYEERDDLDKAKEFYIISAHTEPGSSSQKGLSYLRLAEINFDLLKNYAQAQLYYDSTMQFLAKEYPLYNSVAIKAENLQYLAERLTIIEEQRELLMLANLDEGERMAFIDKKIQTKIEEEQAQQELLNNTASTINTPQSFSTSRKVTSTFYFDNPMAVSQGLNEFKKKWGNRKQEDYWRISSGVATAQITQSMLGNNINNLTEYASQTTNNQDIEVLKKDILEKVPLTAEAKNTALQTIQTAKYEIALFYKDVLNDDKAAINELEQLLGDFESTDPKVAELYYQLYRLYENVNVSRSNEYKQRIINDFPQSSFAKSLLNPDYGKEEEAALLKLQEKYDEIYQVYTKRNYPEVITNINGLENSLQRFPSEGPKFYYLRALAIGNMQKAPVFVNSLQEIVRLYPKDTVVVPLVKSQLEFISANRNTFNNRKTALLRHDDNEYLAPVVVLPSKKTDSLMIKEPKSVKKEDKKQESAKPKEAVVTKSNSEKVETEEIIKPKSEPEKPKGVVFSNNTRIRHAIVIQVKDIAINVAKPFASLTKHFYNNFEPTSINLTIRTVGNTDKLIIARGPFTNKDIAQKALNDLTGSLHKILELKADQFDSFIISEPNLLLINSTENLNQYINFIRQ